MYSWPEVSRELCYSRKAVSPAEGRLKGNYWDVASNGVLFRPHFCPRLYRKRVSVSGKKRHPESRLEAQRCLESSTPALAAPCPQLLSSPSRRTARDCKGIDRRYVTSGRGDLTDPMPAAGTAFDWVEVAPGYCRDVYDENPWQSTSSCDDLAKCQEDPIRPKEPKNPT